MTRLAPIPRKVGLLLALLALLRVRAGRVRAHGPDTFTHRGGPFPRVLLPFLRELVDHGQARLDPRDDGAGPRRVLITDAGAALLADLERNRRNGKAGRS